MLGDDLPQTLHPQQVQTAPDARRTSTIPTHHRGRRGKRVSRTLTNTLLHTAGSGLGEEIAYRGQFQRAIERAKITIFKANLRNHHDRVNHFPAFPSMICDFRSHNFFWVKSNVNFSRKHTHYFCIFLGRKTKHPTCFFVMFDSTAPICALTIVLSIL